MMSFVEKIVLKKIKPKKIEQDLIDINEIVQIAMAAVEKYNKKNKP